MLNRGSGLLGLKIVGGADHSSKPFGSGKPGIFVSKVCSVNFSLHLVV